MIAKIEPPEKIFENAIGVATWAVKVNGLTRHLVFQEIERWIKDNGVGNWTKVGNAIWFNSETDAMMCYLAHK